MRHDNGISDMNCVKNILIVDSKLSRALATAHRLECNQMWPSTIVSTGEAALACVARSHTAVAIVSLPLRGAIELEVLVCLLTEFHLVPVILRGSTDELAVDVECEGVLFLPEPFNDLRLRQLLQSAREWQTEVNPLPDLCSLTADVRDPQWIAKPSGELVYMNTAAEAMTCRMLDEVAGWDLPEMLPFLLEGKNDDAWALLRTGREQVVTLPDSPDRPLHASLHAIKLTGKTCIHVLTCRPTLRLLESERSKPRPDNHMLELHLVVNDALQALSGSWLTHQIDLTLDLEPIVTVHGDRERLALALLHVLENAADAQIDSSHPTIHINIGRDADRAFIRVVDNGCGFGPEADLSSLLLPVVSRKGAQAAPNSPHTALRGRGLGLGISNSIVRRHGGSIQLENGSAGGACVTIWLPRC